MPDDWLLGMSYLLSLSKNHILDAQTIFMDLPQTALHIQTALYYYSLELYKKLHNDSEKIYLYNPLDVINKMIIAARTIDECDIVDGLQYWQSYLLGLAQTSKTGQVEVKVVNALELEEKQEPAQSIDANISNKDADSKEVITSDAIDTEWTDDWGDFSDDSIEATNDTKNNIRSEEISQEETVSLSDRGVAECVTEEDRFNLFQKLFNRIDNIEQYQELKEIISQWAKFNMPNHITLDNHPILKMMKIIIPLIAKTNPIDPERILKEHEELIELLASKEVC